MIPARRLSLTIWRGTPPMNASMATRARQSSPRAATASRPLVQRCRLEAPSTATKISARPTSPGRPVDHLHGVTGEVNEDPLAPAVCTWRSVGFSQNRPTRDTSRRTRNSQTRPGLLSRHGCIFPRAATASRSVAPHLLGEQPPQSGTGRCSAATAGGGGYSSVSSCTSSSPVR